MMTKIIPIFSLMLVIAFGTFSYLQDLAVEKRMQQFMSIGPRFTAKDGQELCETVRTIAWYSIDYQKSGRPLPECHYAHRR